MSKEHMFKAVLKEYGIEWVVNRILYSAKLKTMSIASSIEKIYEKKTPYPKNVDLFHIDVIKLGYFIREKLKKEEKNNLISIADKACDGIINGFSSIELDYGNPIDWQLNPLTGKRCNEKENWYRIPDFDKERGDIKVVWEVSRFSHFITLARAFLLTENEKYYKSFSIQLKQWLDENPYGYGANFKCSQECSLRMVNALLAYTIFKNCGIATDADTSNIKDLIDRSYRKILGNFFYAYKCIKNNHTISELMGMIIGAWCTEDFNQLQRGYSLLDEVISEQFTLDGGYRQFSFNYQRLALQDIEVVLCIENKTGITLSKNSKDRIKNSAMLMYQCQDECGDVPNYGNNDGALVFPVTSCGYRDFRPVINTIYALTIGKELYESGIHQEELIWFAGEKDIVKIQEKKIERVSSQFADAGLFTIRNNISWAMVVSNEYHSRPAHMDQLHLDLWVSGVNVLCDCGTYSYASDEGKQLVKNESHNTALVEKRTQMNSRGPFMIYDWTKRQLDICDDKSFAGITSSTNGYSHFRSVRYFENIYQIKDKVNCDYKVLFHTPCEVLMGNEKVILSYDNKNLCELTSNGDIDVIKSQRSLYYLKKETVNCIAISAMSGKEIETEIKIL